MVSMRFSLKFSGVNAGFSGVNAGFNEFNSSLMVLWGPGSSRAFVAPIVSIWALTVRLRGLWPSDKRRDSRGMDAPLGRAVA